jgi:hypothetical protein
LAALLEKEELLEKEHSERARELAGRRGGDHGQPRPLE